MLCVENMTPLANGTIIDHLAPPELHLIQSVSYLPLLIRRSYTKTPKHRNQGWISKPARFPTSKSFDSVFLNSSTNGSIPSTESSRDTSRSHSRLSSLSSDKSEERHRTGAVSMNIQHAVLQSLAIEFYEHLTYLIFELNDFVCMLLYQHLACLVQLISLWK